MAKPQEKVQYRSCGSYFFIIGTAIFAIAMVVAQLYYPCGKSGCYNIGTNPISDLGNTATSPLWPLFNYSLILFGAMMIMGVGLLLGVLANGNVGKAGSFFLVLSALGAIGVGTVPENTILAIHSISALIAFGAGGIGVLLVGISMLKKDSEIFSTYSIVSGLITVVVLLVFTLPLGLHLSTSGSGFGFGGVERIVAFPIILWVFLTGLWTTKRKK